MGYNQFTYEGTLLRKMEHEIKEGEKRNRTKAAKFLLKKIKDKISDVWVVGKHSGPGEPPGKITGNLIKGLYTYSMKTVSFVGLHAPAFHNYLLEFGHFAGKGANRVWVAARPYFYNTLIENAEEVKKMLSEPWVK
jgi:hypothetical protein